jgi:DNA-binding NarL/FixJ family response regulator
MISCLKILVASDSEMLRTGLRLLISSNPDWEPCGEASVGQAAYELACRKRPDVVVVDMAVPAMAISLARLLCDDLPDARCVILTIHSDAETVKSAVAAGVKGYVLKREGEDGLARAISQISTGRIYYSPAILDVIADIAETDRSRDRPAFSPRELAVIALVAEWRTNADIGARLGISARTAENHRASAMRKAGVRSASELVAFAMRHKIIVVE